MTNPIIAFRNVSKVFEDSGTQVLKDINFELEEGKFYTLLGASGSGKSTILNIIAGLLDATSGDVLLDGKRINDIPINKRDVHTVFQSYALFPHMNVFDNVAFALKLKKVPKKEIEERVEEALKMVQLNGYQKRSIQKLSGGQRQRIGIARALIMQPQCIICDEPISALDVSIQVQIMTLLERLQEQHGISYLFISHDLNMVRYISHRMVVMYLGAIMEEGPALDLYEFPQHPYTRALTALNGPVIPHAPIGAPLKGDPPNPLNPPKGCLFSGRCPEAEGRCFAERPPLRDWADRRIACWHI